MPDPSITHPEDQGNGVTDVYELLLPNQPTSNGHSMGAEEDILKKEHRNGDTIAYNSALVSVLLLVVITWITIFFNHPFTVGWFALHPPLQSLAFLLFTYGILTLQPTSQPKTKVAGLNRHQKAILLLALPLVTVGTFSAAYHKYVKDKPHLVSWHAKFGALCLLWIFFQVLLGGGSVWFGGAAFGGGMKAKSVWKYHRVSGYALYALTLLSVNLGGAWSSWGSHYLPAWVRFFAYMIVPLIAGTAVFARIRLSKMKFF